MKKKFPCGHVGKGQYCHRCKAKDDAVEQKKKEREAKVNALKNDLDVGVDLSGLPEQVAKKAAQIIRKLNSGVSYTDLHGKRLTAWDHNIISIQLGSSYRILCKDDGGNVTPVEVLSHEQYNGRISLARR